MFVPWSCGVETAKYVRICALFIADARVRCSLLHRTVETEDEMHAAIIDNLKALSDIGSDVRRIMSLTLSVREGDVSDAEVEACKDVLILMHQLGVAEDIIMTLERGDAEDHVHMQGMLHGPFKARKGQSNLMKEIFEKRKCFERGVHCCVKVHKPRESMQWKSMAGYVAGPLTPFETDICVMCIRIQSIGSVDRLQL